jgi:hypothetical protein
LPTIQNKKQRKGGCLMERLFKSILFASALSFAGYSADTHLGDGVYLLDENIDPNNSVVKVSISSEQLQKLMSKDFIYDEDSVRVLTFQKELWDISKNKIYSKFNDDFDFIFYVLNGTRVGELGFSGRMLPVRLDCKNIDIYLPNGWGFETYENWSSDSKLKGVIYFPLYNAIKDGPSLHELAHQWGAKVSPDVLGHWGASSAGGQLGGFKYVKSLGDNQYQGSMNGTWNDGFGKDGYSKNVHPYSDIELYLMGFKSAQDLRNSKFKLDVYLDNGAAPKLVSGDGIFKADKINSYTIDDLMKNFGGKERDPNSLNSQKEFKILTVFLSITDTVGQTIYGDRTSKVVEDLNWFAQKTDYSGGYYNFYQATNKVGSIDVSGLKNSVKTDIDKSNPDPNPAVNPQPDGTTPLKEAKPKNKKYGVFFDKNPVCENLQINLKPHVTPKSVKISILDYLGNVVFVEESRETGKKEFVWDLNNFSGRKVANGTYFVVAECVGIDGKLYGYSTKVGVKR